MISDKKCNIFVVKFMKVLKLMRTTRLSRVISFLKGPRVMA